MAKAVALFSLFWALLTQANYAVEEITYLVMAEKVFTEGAINKVFESSHEDDTVARVLKPRASYLECINRLDTRSCDYLMRLGACNTRPRSMKDHCSRSCGFCVDPPCHLSRYGCCFDGKTLATGPHMQGCIEDCKDTYAKSVCRILKKSGKCYTPGSRIKRQCAVTCGYCRPCIDDEPYTCSLALTNNRCSTRDGGFLDICRSTCKMCGKNDPCHDHECPEHSVCRIGDQGTPYCECDGNCKPGDHFTGTVCGRDGNEYKNLCHLKMRNCGNKTSSVVTVKNYGPCNRGVAFSDKRRVCSKKQPDSGLCRSWMEEGYCKTRKKAMQLICPKVCNFCALQSPKASCNYMKHGCCLDKKTPCMDAKYKGCPKKPACKDFSKSFCNRFVAVCGTASHRQTMQNYCPKACHLCE